MRRARAPRIFPWYPTSLHTTCHPTLLLRQNRRVVRLPRSIALRSNAFSRGRRELQAHLPDAPDQLTEKQLLELGNEVGISSDHLRQALAEERTRVVLPEETGVVGSWFGSTMAAASACRSGYARTKSSP